MEDIKRRTHVSPESPREHREDKHEQKHEESFFSELFKFALVALFVVLPFRLFVAQPFIVNGASMDPTFKSGDYLIVDQLSYKFEEPERGTPVIFKYPQDKTKYFIKRIIGLPSETVVVSGDEVIIKNSENPEGFRIDEPYIKFKKTDEQLVVTLKDDEYFVMGDNRIGSSDSRIWGPLPEDLIIGRPLMRLFPLNEASFFPGYLDEPSGD